MTVFDAPAEKVRGEVFNVGHSDENYTKRMVVDTVLDALDGDGVVRYDEGGTDPRNYRVSFEKIRDVLGYEPDHSVPGTVANLIRAVQAGVYNDVDSRPGFYTNHTISPEVVGVHAAGEGAD